MNLPLSDYWGLLADYLRPLWKKVGLLAVLLVGGIALQLANPQVVRAFLDTAQRGGSERALLLAAITFLAIAALQQALTLASSTVGEDVGWEASNRLRSDLVRHCLGLDLSFYKHHTPGALIERVDGDVTALGNFFSQFAIQLLANGVLVVGILALLTREDWRIGLGFGLYALLALGLLRAVQQVATARWVTARAAIADYYGFLEERLAGTEDIRASGAEGYVLARLTGMIGGVMRHLRAARLVGNLSFLATQGLFALGTAAGLALGALLVQRGEASIGTAYLIVAYVATLAAPLESIRQQLDDLQRAGASVGRVRELLATRSGLVESVEARLPDGPLSVAFEGLCFRYEASDTDEVLRGLSLQLPAGRVVGVLGRTGSGKTTLSRLLFRLYDPTEGAVRLGGVDLRTVALADVRQRVGMVTQEVQLFQATVRDNLTFFNPALPDEEIKRLLAQAGLWGWVASLPQGLATMLGPGGQGLSAGEAQLLACARLFLNEPGLVILDEASARLDPATEQRLERALDSLLHGGRRTALIIAHRLSTVMRADDILILEGGRIVEYGPRVLLAADPTSRFAALLATGLETLDAAPVLEVA